MTRYLWQWTHADLDGVGCAVVVAHMFPQHKIDVRYCHYNGPNSIDSEITSFLDDIGEDGSGLPAGEHEILITDIAPSPEVCERLDSLRQVFRRVAIFDHHKTTFKTSEKYLWFIHSENRECATRMLYEQSPLHGDPVHDFVYAVDAWDRWLLESTSRARGEQLNVLYKALGFKEFFRYFAKSPNADTNTWLGELVHLLEGRRDRFVGETVVRQQHQLGRDKRGNIYAVVVGGGEYTSEIGNKLLQKRKEVDYVAIVLPGMDVVSLRSREGGVDVGGIAERFESGGGHAASAGFSREGVFTRLIMDRVGKLLNE